MLKAGSKAPQFTLEDMSGAKQSLAEILSRGPVLVSFYKISCPVCQLTLPYLERISKGSLQVIGISQDDERATAKFQKNYGLTMRMLLDRDSDDYEVSNAFGISHVPSSFLIEPDGKISLATEGFVKRDLESLGGRAGVTTFGPEDHVPEWKAG
jgi:peroxiredoxin